MLCGTIAVMRIIFWLSYPYYHFPFFFFFLSIRIGFSLGPRGLAISFLALRAIHSYAAALAGI